VGKEMASFLPFSEGVAVNPFPDGLLELSGFLEDFQPGFGESVIDSLVPPRLIKDLHRPGGDISFLREEIQGVVQSTESKFSSGHLCDFISNSDAIGLIFKPPDSDHEDLSIDGKAFHAWLLKKIGDFISSIRKNRTVIIFIYVESFNRLQKVIGKKHLKSANILLKLSVLRKKYVCCKKEAFHAYFKNTPESIIDHVGSSLPAGSSGPIQDPEPGRRPP
jgi:hypothetical protein